LITSFAKHAHANQNGSQANFYNGLIIKAISPVFAQRIFRLSIRPPEIEELTSWLPKICDSEGITIKDRNGLRQPASSANRQPRECLNLLEMIYLSRQPLTTTLVKEVAQDQESYDHGSRFTLAE
jgi:hypothetical protein